MKLELSVSSTAKQADQAVLHQTKEAKKELPDSAHLIMAVRDEIRRHTHEAGEDDVVTVKASVSIEVTIEKPKKVSSAPGAATAPDIDE